MTFVSPPPCPFLQRLTSSPPLHAWIHSSASIRHRDYAALFAEKRRRGGRRCFVAAVVSLLLSVIICRVVINWKRSSDKAAKRERGSPAPELVEARGLAAFGGMEGGGGGVWRATFRLNKSGQGALSACGEVSSLPRSPFFLLRCSSCSPRFLFHSSKGGEENAGWRMREDIPRMFLWTERKKGDETIFGDFVSWDIER